LFKLPVFITSRLVVTSISPATFPPRLLMWWLFTQHLKNARCI